MNKAAEHGNIQIFDILSQKCVVTYYTLSASCRSGNLKLVKKIFPYIDNESRKINELVKTASRGNYLDILDFLNQNGASKDNFNAGLILPFIKINTFKHLINLKADNINQAINKLKEEIEKYDRYLLKKKLNAEIQSSIKKSHKFLIEKLNFISKL
jgi:hypothetical protein